MSFRVHTGSGTLCTVFFWWKTESFQNEHLPRVRMAGLDANKKYKVHELNRIDLQPLDVGAYLMNHGLEMPYRNEPEWSKKNDWSSRVLLLEAE